jgi:hypothetical protein
VTLGLPPWLPEWDDAESIAQTVDIEALRGAVRDLVDLVLSEDTGVLDSLPSALESALVAPLVTLAQIADQDGTAIELVVAARLVRRSVYGQLDGSPTELVELVSRLPT